MSLYNALFGMNPLAGPLLTIVGLSIDEVGRFRDCYPKRVEGGPPVVVVLTRNGGGNRKAYEHVFEALRQHPLYVSDWDDAFDSTYASIEFRLPALSVSLVEVLMEVLEAQAPERLRPPMQRFRELAEKMAAGDMNDPAVARALEVGKKIFDKLDETMKDGGGGIVEV